MQILVSRGRGIDVHKDMLAVCVLVYREGQEAEARYKEFATHQKALAALRDWTRYRVKLSEEMNRIHKVLEDASLKLDTMVSHILGGSGMDTNKTKND